MGNDIERVPNRDVEVICEPEGFRVQQAGQALLRMTALPDQVRPAATPASAATLAALESIAAASPEAMAAIRQAAKAGRGLQVTFPKEVLIGLRTGTLRLMGTQSGQMATAVDGAGKIVAHGRIAAGAGVVAGAGTGVAAGAGASIALGAAVVVLPLAIAGAAAYAQQRRLEKSLESIQAVVDRIESRLRDADYGVCDAADHFLELAAAAIDEGGLTDELRHELAVHRPAVESLYAARRRWVRRFKAELEEQQTKQEHQSGKRQPWVDAVVDAVKDDKFDDELLLFLRSLIGRTKLNALAAICLVEGGRPRSALELIATTERELRAEFYDLHNRLAPLARIEPEVNVVMRLPVLRTNLARAQKTVKALVDHLDSHVLPIIPDPDHERDLVVAIGADEARLIGS
jgi:hypothetical protein